MKINPQLFESVYNWAQAQFQTAVYSQDINAAKIAAVLIAVCAGDENKRKEAALKIKLSEDAYGLSKTNSDNLQLDIQYVIVYYGLTGTWPDEIEDMMDIYASVAGEAWQSSHDNELLKAVLLLAQLGKVDPELIPSANTALLFENPVSVYLTADQKELYKLINSIDRYTCFGLQEQLESPELLIPVLEIRLLAAIKVYDLQLACCLIKTLNYLGSHDSMVVSTAVKFLIHNQAAAGFFGYYDQEFKLMNKQTEESKIGYLLASTLQAVIALKEQTSYRFYKTILSFPSNQQLRYEMVAL